MGTRSTLLALVVLLVAPMASAFEAGDIRRRATQDPERVAPFGLMLDAGVTEGAGLSISFRPARVVRLHLGATHNGVRAGARAGLTRLPLRSRVSPAFSVEIGHAQPADVRALERRLADLSLPPLPSLERVGYTYASGLVGFEVSMPRSITFFVRGGVSFMELYGPSLKDLDEPLRGTVGPAEDRSWMLRTVRPTAKLGFILNFG
jgi:hypothetical protein